MRKIVLPASYLVNKMYFKILNFDLINIVKVCFPDNHVINSLLLKVFGCTSFIHEHKNVGNLEPHVINYVFPSSYFPTQKG